MKHIIGCDWHPGHENIAMLDTETGKVITRHLKHDDGEPRAFYAALPPGARVGIEATGCTQGFQQMLAVLGHEVWIGILQRLGRARSESRRQTSGMRRTCWSCS